MSREDKKASHLGVVNQMGRMPAKPPGLLRVIQKNCVSHYEQLLAHLFSATDDLFYDLSKRASSNQEQNLYFEAMREIRIKREGIANQFLRTLTESFALLIEQPDQSLWDVDLDGEMDGALSIVKGDDLEVELAVSNMVSRARDAYRSEIHELSLRLDHLLLQIDIDEKNNPLDPWLIADAFVSACQQGLTTSIKAKLILFKLFEKHVLKQLGHIYVDANQILLEAGILPKIPSSLRNGKDKDRQSTVNAGRRSSDTSQPSQSFNASVAQSFLGAAFSMPQTALGALLDTARNFSQLAPQRPVASGGVGSSQNLGPYQTPRYFIGTTRQPGSEQAINCYIYSSNPGPVMTQPELTQQLTQSQQRMDQHIAGESSLKNIVPVVVQELLAKSNPEQPHALGESDEHVINLVSMFFDQILADESLHVVVQALICRLQIPILKVALKNAAFFSDSSHPARKLINSITSIGIGFDENKPIDRDPVYKKMTDVVKTLNSHYDSDEKIFSRLDSELDAFVEKERRRAELVERRTTQTEEGKAQIKHARIKSQDLVYQKIKQLELPDVVKQFLITHWVQVLVVTYLKKGKESKEWAANEQTITDLIWVSAQHTDARSIQRRERMLPELLDRLEMELEAVITNPSSRRESVALLERALSRDDDSEGVVSDLGPLDEKDRSALGKGLDSPKEWSEMTAVERQQIQYQELAANYFEMAKTVPVGSWIEFTSEDTGKLIRCKLSSKIDVDTYLFTNRMGFKVLEKTRKQLAYDMQFKRVTVLDSRPLFDRVMDSVVGNISLVKS